jgi:hypothetical protein
MFTPLPSQYWVSDSERQGSRGRPCLKKVKMAMFANLVIGYEGTRPADTASDSDSSNTPATDPPGIHWPCAQGTLSQIQISH